MGIIRRKEKENKTVCKCTWNIVLNTDYSITKDFIYLFK